MTLQSDSNFNTMFGSVEGFVPSSGYINKEERDRLKKYFYSYLYSANKNSSDYSKLIAIGKFNIFIHPGNVRNDADGNVHYLNSDTLANLYGLKRGQYVVINKEINWEVLGYYKKPGDIHLYPRNKGDYSDRFASKIDAALLEKIKKVREANADQTDQTKECKRGDDSPQMSLKLE